MLGVMLLFVRFGHNRYGYVTWDCQSVLIRELCREDNPRSRVSCTGLGVLGWVDMHDTRTPNTPNKHQDPHDTAL